MNGSRLRYRRWNIGRKWPSQVAIPASHRKMHSNRIILNMRNMPMPTFGDCDNFADALAQSHPPAPRLVGIELNPGPPKGCCSCFFLVVGICCDNIEFNPWSDRLSEARQSPPRGQHHLHYSRVLQLFPPSDSRFDRSWNGLKRWAGRIRSFFSWQLISTRLSTSLSAMWIGCSHHIQDFICHSVWIHIPPPDTSTKPTLIPFRWIRCGEHGIGMVMVAGWLDRSWGFIWNPSLKGPRVTYCDNMMIQFTSIQLGIGGGSVPFLALPHLWRVQTGAYVRCFEGLPYIGIQDSGFECSELNPSPFIPSLSLYLFLYIRSNYA